MTTLDKVLAARLVGGLQSSSIKRIDDRVFVRLREIRIEETGFTLMADGNLSIFIDGTDRNNHMGQYYELYNLSKHERVTPYKIQNHRKLLEQIGSLPTIPVRTANASDQISLQTVLDGGVITVSLPSAYIEVKIG